MPKFVKSVAAALLTVGVLTVGVAPAQAAPQSAASSVSRLSDTAWD